MTKAGNNPYTERDDVQEYIDRVFEIEDQIAVIKGDLGAKIKALMADVKDVINEAKEKGINKPALKAVIAKQRYLNKAENVGEDLAEAEANHFEMMQHALGMLADLPLGQAATAAAARTDQGNLDQVGRGKGKGKSKDAPLPN